MSRPLLLTDVDGVLLDWIRGFKEFYMDLGYVFTSPDPTNFPLTGWIEGVNDPAEIMNLLSGFNHSKEFSQLKPTTGARQFISAVAKDYDIIAITACSDRVAGARRANLEAVFGTVFNTIHCLNLGESKYKILSKYKPSIWIEDNVSGADAGVLARHDAYLLDKEWNQGELDPDIKRVPSLAYILKDIT